MGSTFFGSDAELEKRFEEIVKTYEKKVYRTAYKTAQNPHDAYDITQEVFISIARNLNSFKGESSLSTWIYRITANKCIDYGRKQQKTSQLYIDEDISEGESLRTIRAVGSSYNPEEHLEKTGLQKEIKEALNKLSHDHREMIILRDIDDFSTTRLRRSPAFRKAP